MNPTPKAERDAALIALVQAGSSLKEAGQRFGLTRERARQIYKRAFPNGPSVVELRPRPTPCSRCGKKPAHGLLAYQYNLCQPCRRESHKHVITCIVCGGSRTIYSKSAAAQQKGLFCSKRCQGKWIARNHGWGTPRNPAVNGGSKKKEFCLRHHPLSGENLYFPLRGGRRCRACRKIRSARYYAALLTRRASR